MAYTNMTRRELEIEAEARWWEKWAREAEEDREEARRAVPVWMETITEQFGGLDEGLKAVKMFLDQFDGHISPRSMRRHPDDAKYELTPEMYAEMEEIFELRDGGKVLDRHLAFLRSGIYAREKAIFLSTNRREGFSTFVPRKVRKKTKPVVEKGLEWYRAMHGVPLRHSKAKMMLFMYRHPGAHPCTRIQSAWRDFLARRRKRRCLEDARAAARAWGFSGVIGMVDEGLRRKK